LIFGTTAGLGVVASAASVVGSTGSTVLGSQPNKSFSADSNRGLSTGKKRKKKKEKQNNKKQKSSLHKHNFGVMGVETELKNHEKTSAMLLPQRTTPGEQGKKEARKKRKKKKDTKKKPSLDSVGGTAASISLFISWLSIPSDAKHSTLRYFFVSFGAQSLQVNVKLYWAFRFKFSFPA
jgi:hypothetical protein